MSEENPVPESDNSAPATDDAKDHRIPKSRFDEELSKRHALEEELVKMADAILQAVPDNLRDLIPEGMSPQEKVTWFNKAKATGVFDEKKAPDVPVTDQGKPKTQPLDKNIWDIPASERIAMGLREKG